jgi:hypothetical protein
MPTTNSRPEFSMASEHQCGPTDGNVRQESDAKKFHINS